MLTTQQATKKYGTPTVTGAEYLVTLELPYPMRLAWDLDTKVNKMRVHKLVKNNFKGVFDDLLAHYGYEKLVELGIDLFGGCFAYRKMRGGSSWSMHSWGIAIDLDPVRNQLKETSRTVS